MVMESMVEKIILEGIGGALSARNQFLPDASVGDGWTQFPLQINVIHM